MRDQKTQSKTYNNGKSDDEEELKEKIQQSSKATGNRHGRLSRARTERSRIEKQVKPWDTARNAVS